MGKRILQSKETAGLKLAGGKPINLQDGASIIAANPNVLISGTPANKGKKINKQDNLFANARKRFESQNIKGAIDFINKKAERGEAASDISLSTVTGRLANFLTFGRAGKVDKFSGGSGLPSAFGGLTATRQLIEESKGKVVGQGLERILGKGRAATEISDFFSKVVGATGAVSVGAPQIGIVVEQGI